MHIIVVFFYLSVCFFLIFSWIFKKKKRKGLLIAPRLPNKNDDISWIPDTIPFFCRHSYIWDTLTWKLFQTIADALLLLSLLSASQKIRVLALGRKKKSMSSTSGIEVILEISLTKIWRWSTQSLGGENYYA